MEPNQELIFKLSFFEQQMGHLQQQLQAVEQGIIELSTLNLDLKDMIGKNGEEIFAPIGRGIFAKAKLISEELMVDIGDRNFVKKSVPETQKTLSKQITKLVEVKKELGMSLDQINSEAEKMIREAQQKGEL